MQLSTDEVKLLKKVLKYVLENEKDNFNSYLKEGGKKEEHIYYHATMLQYIVDLKKDLPPVKLSGDTKNLFGEY